MRIGVLGAGSIGCYVGGRLIASGADVVLAGRPRVRDEIAGHGLRLFDVDGAETGVSADRVTFVTEPAGLAGCDVILCAVKSAQTESAAAEIAAVVGPDAVVVSLQNGVGNAAVLRRALPGRTVLAGIVSFNVVGREGSFRQGTSGPLILEASDEPRAKELFAAIRRSTLPLRTPRDIVPHQWAKLLMNLGNAISALSGAPTRDLILLSGYRSTLRAVIREALDVLDAADIRPAWLRGVPPWLLARILALPTPVVRVVARAQLRVNADARSSMWEDLERRRTTEVDYLNGEIVRLAERVQVAAPLNRSIVDLVHDVERRAAGSPGMSPEALSQALGLG